MTKEHQPEDVWKDILDEEIKALESFRSLDGKRKGIDPGLPGLAFFARELYKSSCIQDVARSIDTGSVGPHDGLICLAEDYRAAPLTTLIRKDAKSTVWGGRSETLEDYNRLLFDFGIIDLPPSETKAEASEGLEDEDLSIPLTDAKRSIVFVVLLIHEHQNSMGVTLADEERDRLVKAIEEAKPSIIKKLFTEWLPSALVGDIVGVLGGLTSALGLG